MDEDVIRYRLLTQIHREEDARITNAEIRRWLEEIESIQIRVLKTLARNARNDKTAQPEPEPRAVFIDAFSGPGELLLDAWTSWMPKRVADEELGDIIERLTHYREQGQSTSRIVLRLSLPVFWLVVHSIVHILRSLVATKKLG